MVGGGELMGWKQLDRVSENWEWEGRARRTVAGSEHGIREAFWLLLLV